MSAGGEVIDLASSSSSEDENDDVEEDTKSSPRVETGKRRRRGDNNDDTAAAAEEIVDLRSPSPPPRGRSRTNTTAVVAGISWQPHNQQNNSSNNWSCQRCTNINPCHQRICSLCFLFRQQQPVVANANNAAAAVENDQLNNLTYEELIEIFGIGNENRNIGASISIISSLPVSTLSDPHVELPEEMRTCHICLEDFVTGEKRKCLPCLHGYHDHCVDRWLMENGVCPVCKTPVSD